MVSVADTALGTGEPQLSGAHTGKSVCFQSDSGYRVCSDGLCSLQLPPEVLKYPTRPHLASLSCYYWRGHWKNNNIKISSISLCTSFVHWVPEVIWRRMLWVRQLSPSGAQVCGFTPESQISTSVSSENQADPAHLLLFLRNDFCLWCTWSNFICWSSSATIEQMNTLRKMGFYNSLLSVNVA